MKRKLCMVASLILMIGVGTTQVRPAIASPVDATFVSSQEELQAALHDEYAGNIVVTDSFALTETMRLEKASQYGTITISSDSAASEHLTISNSITDCTTQSSMFEIAPYQGITFNNINLQGKSNACDSMVVTKGGNVTFDSAVVSDNHTLSNGGVVRAEASAGTYPQVRFNNAVMRNNSASYGGVVYTDGPTQSIGMDHVLAEQNLADYGGVVAATTLMMVYYGDVTMQDNAANYDGGAIWYGSEVQQPAVATNFIRNTAGLKSDTASGGAYYSESVNGPYLGLMTATDNRSGGSCGALDLRTVSNPYYSISHTTLSGNSAATFGGAMCVNSASIGDAVFSSNTASNGGAVYALGTVALLQTTFLANEALEYGGGLLLDGTTSGASTAVFYSYMPDSTTGFTGNVANNGGGVAVLNPNMTFKLDGGAFKNNVAHIDGGAIYTPRQQLGNLSVGSPWMDTEFINNSAQDYSAVVMSAEQAIYDTNVITDKITWSKSSTTDEAFTHGYNNYDISYDARTVRFIADESQQDVFTDVHLYRGDLIDESDVPETAERPGEVMLGWIDVTTGKLFDISSAVTRNVTVSALYGASHFDVTFDARNGDSPTVVSVERDQLVTVPETPVLEGFDFVGWFVQDCKTYPCVDTAQRYDFTKPLESETSLFAKWQRSAIAVTIDYRDGSPVQELDGFFYGDDLSVAELDIPTREGFDFAGWFLQDCSTDVCVDTDVKVEDTVTLTDALSLYAQWTEVEVEEPLEPETPTNPDEPGDPDDPVLPPEDGNDDTTQQPETELPAEQPEAAQPDYALPSTGALAVSHAASTAGALMVVGVLLACVACVIASRERRMIVQ